MFVLGCFNTIYFILYWGIATSECVKTQSYNLIFCNIPQYQNIAIILKMSYIVVDSNKLSPESFFEQRSQRSLEEECSHRSKGKQTRERLRILQKNEMRIHYKRCSKTENPKCRLLHGG